MKTTKRCLALLLSTLMVLTVVPAISVSAAAPVKTSVVNGQNGVPVNASFVLTYADAASTAGVAITTAAGEAVEASITANGTEVTIDPIDNLAAKTQYKITADGTDISFYTSDGTEHSSFADFEEAKTGSDLYSYIVASGFQPGNMYVTENGGAGAGAMEISASNYPDATKALVDAGNAVIKAADGKFVFSAKAGYQANMEFRWPNGVTPKSIVKIDFDISTPSFKDPSPTYTYLYDFLKLRNSSAAYERYALMDWGWRLAPVAAVSGVGANAAIQQSNPSDNNTRYYLYNNNSTGAQKHITMIADLEAGTTKLYSDGAYVGTTYEVADAKGTTFSRILLNINALTWTAGEPKALIDNLAFTEVIKPVATKAEDDTVAINFNTPMPAGEVSGATFGGVAVTPVISGDGYTLTCAVPDALKAGDHALVLPDLEATNTYTLAGASYTFTVTRPQLSGTFVKASVANGENGVAVNESFTLTFAEDITATGGVGLYNASTDAEVDAAITMSGKKVTINPADNLAANTQYKISAPGMEDILFYTGSDAGYAAFVDFEGDLSGKELVQHIHAGGFRAGNAYIKDTALYEISASNTPDGYTAAQTAGNAALKAEDGRLKIMAKAGNQSTIEFRWPDANVINPAPAAENIVKVDFDIQIPYFDITRTSWNAGELLNFMTFQSKATAVSGNPNTFSLKDNGAKLYNSRLSSSVSASQDESFVLFSGNTNYDEKHITLVHDGSGTSAIMYVYCDGVYKGAKTIGNSAGAFDRIKFDLNMLSANSVTATATAPVVYVDNMALTVPVAPVATAANDGTVTITFNTPMPAGEVSGATFNGEAVTPVISADGYTLTCAVPAGTAAGTYNLALPKMKATNTLDLAAAEYSFTVEATEPDEPDEPEVPEEAAYTLACTLTDAADGTVDDLAGKALKANVTVTQTAGADGSVYLLAGLYDAEGMLLELVTDTLATSKTAPATKTVNFEGHMEASKVKVFVWKALDAIKPLTNFWKN